MNQLVLADQTPLSGRIPMIVARGLTLWRSPAGLQAGTNARAHWALPIALGRCGGRTFDLDVPVGAFVVVLGESGSGKSALVRMLSGLERSNGKLSVGGVRVDELGDSELADFRGRSVSVVLPEGNLLPRLTLQQNLELPLLLSKLSRSERRERAASALEMIGLGNAGKRYPNQVQAGDVQRAAIARALLNGANLIVLDEPCRGLQGLQQTRVLDLLSQLNAVFRKTIVLATRDESASQRASHIERLPSARRIPPLRMVCSHARQSPSTKPEALSA
ncbi:MAG: ATP-binding cassette domain-containing protein [Myxococcota bacterium]